MPRTFQPLPDDEPPLTLPEFLRRLKTEPAFVAKMRAHYEAALAVPLSEETTAMHEAARKALRALKHHDGAFQAREKLKELERLLDEAREENRERMTALMDEVVDHLLDVGEPERTRLMLVVTLLRDDLRDMLGGL